MRLHSLSATAFGPFPQRIEVDFDALSEAGVFLLSGATGAGKTSVLDAVAFALYGEVPGDRQQARRLRCDLADPEVAPEVCLEFSLGVRRFRVTRSPAWERPKRRGTGLTTVPAKVHCLELVGEAWQVRSTRIDEVAHLLSSLIGLTHAQFCQVVMLPQGRFQAFLRAAGDDRRRLLQRLFRTDRFGAVESWFAEHRRTTRREADDAWQQVSWWADAVEAELAPSDDVGQPNDTDTLLTWANTARRNQHRNAQAAAAAVAHATAAATRAEAALSAALELETLRQRHARATALAGTLAGECGQIADYRARLTQAALAERLAPLLTEHVRTEQQLALARAQADACLAVAGRLPPASAAAPEEALADLIAHSEAIRQLRPLLAAVVTATAEAADASQLLSERRAHHDRLSASVAAHTGELSRLTDQRAAAEAAFAELESAQQQLAQLRELCTSLARRDDLRNRYREVDNETQRLGRQHLETKEEWLALVEQRFAGMAAELARGLAAGCSCPVCGSTAHPHKARIAPHAPDRAAEQHAQRRTEDSEVLWRAGLETLQALSGQLKVFDERLGDQTVSDVRQSIDAMEREIQPLVEAAAGLTDLGRRVAEATTSLQRCRDAQEQAGRELARAEATAEQAGRFADRARAELSAAGAETGDPAARLAEVAQQEPALDQALAAVRDWCAIAGQHAQRAAALQTAAHTAGFSGASAVAEAILSEEMVAELSEAIRRHDAAHATVTGELADPDLRHAAAAAAPDLDYLRHAQSTTRTAAEAAVESATLTADRARRVTTLVASLGEAHARWLPTAGAADTVAALAGVLEGRHPDNQAQLRLSEFVLAHRLGEVVAAANTRLVAMTDQRYQLQQVAARRGGLSLEVIDAWSGRSRDPATLSGGEGFVVSLALALGLADVIAGEAGAQSLDTLFVDEGFGSLDSDTLTDVLDTVDGLREGGRVVGLVSHVPEMRERIPTRLHVDKRRQGSTVRLVRGRTG